MILTTTAALASDQPLTITVSDELLASWMATGGSNANDEQTARADLSLTLSLAIAGRAAGLADRPPHRAAVIQVQSTLGWEWLESTLPPVEPATKPRLMSLPERRRTHNLYLAFPYQADQQMRQSVIWRADALRQQVSDTESFKQLAVRHSDSQTRLHGGVIGNVRKGQLPPDVEAVIWSLEPGEVSEPLISDNGVTLLYLATILPAETIERPGTPDRTKMLAAKTERISALDQTLDFEFKETGEAWVAKSIYGNWSETLLALLLEQPISPESQSKVRQIKRGYHAWHTAQQQGLMQEDPFQEQLFWETTKALANAFLADQISAQFEPLGDDELKRFFETIEPPLMGAERWVFRAIATRLPAEDRSDEIRQQAWKNARVLRQSWLKTPNTIPAELIEASVLPKEYALGVTISKPQLAGVIGVDGTRALQQAAVGRVTRPVESNGLLWMFVLDEVRPQEPLGFEAARSEIERLANQMQIDEIKARVISNWE